MVGVGNAKLYGIQGHATLEDCQDGTHLFVNAGDEGGGEVPDVVRSEARVGLVLVEGGVGTTFGERGVLDDGAVQVVVAGCFGFCAGGAGGFGFSGQRRHVVRGGAMRNRSIWNTCGVGGWGEALVILSYTFIDMIIYKIPGKGVTCFYLTKTQHLVS